MLHHDSIRFDSIEMKCSHHRPSRASGFEEEESRGTRGRCRRRRFNALAIQFESTNQREASPLLPPWKASRSVRCLERGASRK